MSSYLKKINWIKINKIRTFSYVKKFNNKFFFFISFETKLMIKIFYIVVFEKKVMVLDTLMKFLNLSVFDCKRSVTANTLNVMYFQIITHFFVTIIQFYEKLI